MHIKDVNISKPAWLVTGMHYTSGLQQQQYLTPRLDTFYNEFSTVMLNLFAVKVTNVIRDLGNLSTYEILQTKSI